MSRIKWFDAIRAFGLLLVLGYHLFYNLLPSGFLGVDVFFTFSGYLITAIILDEVRRRDRFALGKFFLRRTQRIFIPLALSVVFTLPFALLVSPDFTVNISKQVAAALSFTANWREIQTAGSYESSMLPSLYRHTWSLAVVMQFYIIWGLLCALAAGLARRADKRDAARRYQAFEGIVLVLSCLAAVVSLWYMQFSYSREVSLDAIYFNSLSRFFPFAIGAFAATIWGMSDKQDTVIKKTIFAKHAGPIICGLIFVTLGAAGLIVFCLSQFSFSSEFTFRYGFLFASLLTVVMIYGTHAIHLATPKKMEEPRLLKAIAAMSYDLYLFHWPLYVVFSALIMNNLFASLVTLLVSFVMSALMVYGAEPLLIPPKGAAGPRRYSHAAAGVLLTTTVCASIAAGMVIARAPLITSIESDFAAEYTLMDVHNVLALESHLLATDGLHTSVETPTVAAPPPVGEGTVSASSPTDARPEEASVSDNALPEEGGVSENTLPAPVEAVVRHKPIGSSRGFIGRVTIIGDSVPLGAQSALAEAIPSLYMDASISRPIKDGVEILAELQDNYMLREYVVIALGTNEAANYKKLFTEMIEMLNPGHRLVFVTPYDGRANEYAQRVAEIAVWMRGLPEEYDFITVADWAALIDVHTDWLASDKSHMGGPKSRELYTSCVVAALETAGQRETK
ncbi:MAG: acyltransferase [Lachnospiraceae bacterium]|jgi:peptidoglycan/LPS O-acetylase OafA/YrhL|nr:acyltransferase [Lachnospiraceae bacterium]